MGTARGSRRRVVAVPVRKLRFFMGKIGFLWVSYGSNGDSSAAFLGCLDRSLSYPGCLDAWSSSLCSGFRKFNVFYWINANRCQAHYMRNKRREKTQRFCGALIRC